MVEKCKCNIGGLVLLGRGLGLGGDVDALIFQEYTEAKIVSTKAQVEEIMWIRADGGYYLDFSLVLGTVTRISTH